MRKIATILLTLLPFAAFAQDLNPTVEVTNAYDEYEVRAVKPSQTMAVPDSLLSFRLSFDYSVHDNPYKGAYSFSPFSIELRPEDSQNGEKQLFVKLGAGYSFRPSVDAVWTPVVNPHFKMNLYASHHSYFGKYRDIYASQKNEGQYRLKRLSGSRYSGHDSYTVAGVNGHADYLRTGLWFNVGYYGIHSKSREMSTGFNAFDASISVQSHDERATHLYYRAALDIRYAREGLSGNVGLGDCEVAFRGSFGPVIGGESKVLVDFEADASYLTSLIKSNAGTYAIIPKYVLQTGSVRLNLGVRLSGVAASDDIWQGYNLNACEGQFVFPDVYASLDLVDSALNIFGGATGGYTFNSYSSVKAERHFLNPWYSRGTCAFLNNSIDKLHVYGGLRGSAGANFAYELRAGHRSVKNGLLDAAYTDGSALYAGVTYKDYSLSYLGMELRWDSRLLLIEARMDYSSSNIWKKALAAFEPSQLSADIRARLKVQDKYLVGIGIEGCSRRRGMVKGLTEGADDFDAAVPAWTNVSLDFEYEYSDRLSFWAAADNLFDMTIQRHPLTPDNGLSITVGVLFSM